MCCLSTGPLANGKKHGKQDTECVQKEEKGDQSDLGCLLAGSSMYSIDYVETVRLVRPKR